MESPEAFCQLYRMDLGATKKLCSWIDPFVEVDPVMSGVWTGKYPIMTKVALHCLLQWLAGGSDLDIQISVGISTTSFCEYIHKYIYAISQCNGFEIKFPKLQGEFEESAQKFKSISTDGVIDSCVACLDGMLLPI